MPTATLSRQRIEELLPDEAHGPKLDALLFSSKAEVESSTGDDLVVSCTPDRLDLLTEGGVALYLQGAVGAARGLPPGARDPGAAELEPISVDPNVDPLRPAIEAVVVQAPGPAGLDAGLLAEAIRFQELLHATVGRDRRAASLGIYPLERLAPPISYALEPLASIRFVPLDATEELSADAFFAGHPMAARYGSLGRAGDRCLVLRDARGSVLSLPPILNSRAAGEARAGDRQLLLESTGTRLRSVREALGLLLVPFVARGWNVRSVARGGPTEVAEPWLAPRRVDVPAELVRSVAGHALGSAEVEHRLASARLGARPHAGGWTVEVPPWRPDVGAPIDVVEEIVLAVPVDPSDGTIPPSRTRGRRLPSVELRRRVAEWMLGLGYALPNTPALVSEAMVARIGGPAPIRLLHPVSLEFAYLRDRLFPSHLGVLERNTRHGYPQRIAEIAPVVVRAPKSESGGETRYHAGALIAADGAGFADAAALVDYLLRALDVGSVREPAEIPGTIAGRAARIRTAGDVVAEVGEVEPRLLTELGVPVAVAWAELDLTALGPLVGRAGTA